MPSLSSDAVDFHTSGWLNVVPLIRHHFNLSAQQFMMICLCYNHSLYLMLQSYDKCGGIFSLTHALYSCKGGLITQCHNEIRDALGDLAALGCQKVVCEPIVCDEIGNCPALIPDL